MPKSAVWLCGMKKEKVVGKAIGKWSVGVKIDFGVPFETFGFYFD